MAAYHQMGHDSENLLSEEGLGAFAGAILSPVNYVEDRVSSQIAWAGAGAQFETVFDPQLYFPNTDRGHLREWSYFPTDVDTADLTSDAWWSTLVDNIVGTCRRLKPTAACSPAVVPNTFSNDYFSLQVRVGNLFCDRLEGSNIRTYQTAVIGTADIATPQRSLAVASILSRTQAEQIYLVFYGDTDPRRELNQTEQLKGAMRLISELERSGVPVLVGFCSSDVVLWKAAGASSCATGKFFNLRRFSRARFEEPPQGGGQLAYWLEEALFAFLRESDLIRVSRLSLLNERNKQENPFAREILSLLTQPNHPAWVALGWRQFMFWFTDIEARMARGKSDPRELLALAETNWRLLEDATPPVLMEEPRNDGSWLRPWRRALVEFSAD